MGLFELIVFLVLALALIEAGTKLALPVAKRVAELIGESAREKRMRREGLEAGPLPGQVVEEIEARLIQIEDRLDFLEQLRTPTERRSLAAGSDAPNDRA